jgi:hypothetical protein
MSPLKWAHIQKSVAFLYNISKVSGKETKKIILLTIATKRKKIKELGINFSSEVKDLYIENRMTLMKEIKYTNKCKDIAYSWIRRINIVKMCIIPSYL